MLPCSEASERNKGPILAVLREAFAGSRRVLEIGSGTGQHAVWFARHMPHLEWQPSDLPEEMPGLQSRLAVEGPPNVRAPLVLDVTVHPWPVQEVDAIFSANTLHIMSWSAVEQFFAGADRVLADHGALLAVYGPFRYRGDYTTASNAEFDCWLKRRDPQSGIRDFEAVDRLARQAALDLVADHAMPANNQLLIWSR